MTNYQILCNGRPVRVNIPTMKKARIKRALLKFIFPKADLSIVTGDVSKIY